LCWNVRGLNDKAKWEPIRNKIDESNANIFCLQETKKDDFDLHFIRKFAPKKFDKFEFCPSVGASGGILVCWASSYFSMHLIDKQQFATDFLSPLLTILRLGLLLLFMVPADNRPEMILLIGFSILILMRMIFGFS
jgi:hypothetical protein